MQTRLVVVVDGLDSCEQSKVLSVLDAVHMLFSDEGSPFIILLAIDPHVVSKAVEINIHQVCSMLCQFHFDFLCEKSTHIHMYFISKLCRLFETPVLVE